MSAQETYDYTPEEMLVLASIRKSSGRTCRRCKWLVAKGGHKGCYPNEKYRKWLSQIEYESGCDLFLPLSEKE